MRSRLVGSYILLVVLALTAFTVPVVLGTSANLRGNLESTAEREADLFVPLVLRDDPEAAQSVEDRTQDFERAFDARVRLWRAGDAVDDTQVGAALGGKDPAPVSGEHPLLGAPGVSVVVPVRRDGVVVGAVQVVAGTAEIDREIRETWLLSLVVGAVVLLLATVVAGLLASSLTRSLTQIAAVARRHGDGEFAASAPERGPPESVLLARTLNRTARQTAALLDSQRSFVADASHQLRTPLAAMRLNLDTVRETLGDPRILPRLDAVDGEIQRMDQLVEGLLTIARAEAELPPRTVVDLADGVRERVEIWQAALEEADVEAAVEVEGVMGVEIAPGALEQVLDNVLDNAVSVSPPGSTIRLRCSYGFYGVDEVVLTVADRGPGLTPEGRERAFDRFWTTRPGEGSGLGLAVVRQLVERDGGRVELVPHVGGGLVVQMTWPGAVRS